MNMLRCENCFCELHNEDDVCQSCGHKKGQPAAELYHIFPGTELKNRYIIGQVLGFGGFGITYKAWDKQFDTVVAIKEYYPSGLVNRIPGKKEVILFAGNRFKEYNMGLTRFLDEARNMAKFHKHPNIVNIFEFFEENNTAYIVMEYLEGETVADRLKRSKKLSCYESLNILLPIINTLIDIHGLGILHGEVSPYNIFIKKDNQIKLLNFDPYRQMSSVSNATSDGHGWLLNAYSAIEQYTDNGRLGAYTDVYAIGATVYEMITGIRPPNATTRLVNDTIKPLTQYSDDVDTNTEKAILHAMSINIKHRTKTMKDFKKELLRENSKNYVNIFSAMKKSIKDSANYKSMNRTTCRSRKHDNYSCEVSRDTAIKLTRCIHNHYYNSNKYSECPYCDLVEDTNREELSIVRKIYVGMNPAGREKLYYGDEQQAYAILNKLNQILQKVGEYNSEKSFNLCNQVYIQVWIRKHGGLSPEFLETHYIKQSLGQKFNFINNEILLAMIDECIRIIYEKEPEIRQRDAIIEYREKMHLENAEKNKNVELNYINDLDYGLVQNKPAFVNGFGNDKVFLDNLQTNLGEQIKYKRMGSISVDGINGPVDIYTISKTDETEYGKIFVCNYGTTMPPRAPKGYKFKNDGV